MPVQLMSGFLDLHHSSGSPTSVNSLSLRVRTRSPDAILVSFMGEAFLELQQGGVVYRRGNVMQQGQVFSSITLAAPTRIDNGLWHTISLQVEDSYTMVGGAVGVAMSVRGVASN